MQPICKIVPLVVDGGGGAQQLEPDRGEHEGLSLPAKGEGEVLASRGGEGLASRTGLRASLGGGGWAFRPEGRKGWGPGSSAYQRGSDHRRRPGDRPGEPGREMGLGWRRKTPTGRGAGGFGFPGRPEGRRSCLQRGWRGPLGS